MATIRVCIRGNTCANWARSKRKIGRSTRPECTQPNSDLQPLKKAGSLKTRPLCKTPARIVGLCSESDHENPALSRRSARPVYTCRPVSDPNKKPDTDFGYERVPWGDKQRRVRGVFDSVAPNYDLMNDLMSGGAHRLWKEFTLSLTGLHAGQRALDVAGGTGDLTTGLAKQVGKSGMVVLSDINAAMLGEGRDRLLDSGHVGNVNCVLANAEKLPFADAQFDCVTIGFGLRNVTNKPDALADMRRVLKPGGQVLVLEFSHPVLPLLKPLYDLYSFRILPLLGKLVAN